MIHISEKLSYLLFMYNILKNRRNGNHSSPKGMSSANFTTVKGLYYYRISYIHIYHLLKS